MATFVSYLNPYQFAFNGWTFGAGTNYTVVNVQGLAGLPPLRVQDDIRGYTDGSYSGRDFYDGRTVTIEMVILGNSSNPAQYYYNQLQQNLYPQQIGTPSQLGAFQFETSTSIGLKVMYGRVRKIDTTIDPEFTYGYIQATVEFFFPDPRYYDYPSNGASGTSVSLTNNGWATSCPVITIASNPGTFTITDSSSNYMSFAATSGTTVVVDLLQRTITQNGSPNRSILTNSTGWLNIPPMSTNVFSSGASMSVVYSDAYV
jgi:hypothetical protein